MSDDRERFADDPERVRRRLYVCRRAQRTGHVKRVYPDPAAALAACREMSEIAPSPVPIRVAVYYCSVCGGWHWGRHGGARWNPEVSPTAPPR